MQTLPSGIKKVDASDNATVANQNRNDDLIDAKITTLNGHLANTSNPHNVTAAQVGAETPAGAQAKATAVQTNLTAHIGTGGAAHAVATQSTAGFESAADKTKLDGIATGAGQANSATDTVIGTRTINDAIALGAVDTDTPTNLFSKIGAMIRAITGKADWYLAPTKSLEQLNTDKVDKVAGKQLSTEDYTTAEKTKLTNIAANANNYEHPASHPPSIIAQDASNRFVTDAEKTTWNGKASTSVATTGANGLMSAADKAKVDGISAGAGYASGTYTGNGAATRDITLPFTPSSAIVMRRDGASLSGGGVTYGGLALTGNPVVTGSSVTAVSIGTSKITVAFNGNASTNENGVVYHYLINK